MFMVIPTYVVKFTPKPGGDTWNWTVGGADELDMFCKVLRRNGIHRYAVTPGDDFPVSTTGDPVASEGVRS